MVNDVLSSGFIGEDIPANQDVWTEVKSFYVSETGYSQLYQCRRHGKLHILKSLKPFYARQDFYRQLQLKEFNIGYQLEHLNICRTLGWEKHEGLGNCIVLEYIDGVTLQCFMEQGRLTHSLARKLITEICEALQYIHSKQIVHRDLKPANILVTYNGNNVKLIDFGLSDCDDYEILKLPAGTRKYLAPEQLAPHAFLDNRIDIYSLGVIIGEMAALLKDRLLGNIARKCTQRDPDKRYASAAEIIEALKKKSYRVVYKYAALAAVLLIFMGGYLQNSWVHRNILNEDAMHRIYSNSSISAYAQQGLMDECSRLNQKRMNRKAGPVPDRRDSLQLLKGLEKILNEEFPLGEMRQSAYYQRRFNDILSVVDRQMEKLH